MRVRKEYHSFPPRPSTMQYYWFRYVCEKCGAGPVACKYSDTAHQSSPRPSTMQDYWLRYVCENYGAGPVACKYSATAHQSPPRPSTIHKNIGSGTCEKRTPFFPTPPFRHSLKVLIPYICTNGLINRHNTSTRNVMNLPGLQPVGWPSCRPTSLPIVSPHPPAPYPPSLC